MCGKACVTLLVDKLFRNVVGLSAKQCLPHVNDMPCRISSLTASWRVCVKLKLLYLHCSVVMNGEK